EFALLVDKDTLSEGAEPTQHGNQILVKNIEGKDGNDNPISGLGLIYRFEDDITEADLMFKTLFTDDLYYTLISLGNFDVNKDDLVILDKMDLIFVYKEMPVVPLTFTFEYDKVNENSQVYVFHKIRGEEELSTDWELITPTVGNGTFTAEFNSLSPVVLYADATTLNGYEEPVIPEEPSEPLSPVTGDSDMGYALLIGIIALAGMGIVVKKNY
ncbi:MAG TPA: LPXTG cell wall anchor domain-containing protein, partial [Anaerovoracaceae bacterium]|nr:LPXTG cell wall anchor domain-containing protein [Anaerovoracaceae bacterium]